MALLKPFRALRYDPRTAGALDRLVAPPYDVITPEVRERLLQASPYNAVRLIRPDAPQEAARTVADWSRRGVLVREDAPAVWLLEEVFRGPDGVARTRTGIIARIKIEPYSSGAILPHEKTFPGPKEARLRLLREVRMKLSPILFLHEGEPPDIPQEREPDVVASLEGATSRLWRVQESKAVERVIKTVRGRLIIADGHHRYETALAFSEEGGEEFGYVLGGLVSRHDSGIRIFPTHRLVGGSVPPLDGGFRLTDVDGEIEDLFRRLEGVPRDHSAFVLLRKDGAVLAERIDAGTGPLDAIDTAAVEALCLDQVSFTVSAKEAVTAVRTGAATAALLVRAPTMEQIEAVALAGETMPQKSTYFFPKLTSGLLFSPFDE